MIVAVFCLLCVLCSGIDGEGQRDSREGNVVKAKDKSMENCGTLVESLVVEAQI